MALAYRAVKIQGYKVPPAHFWAVIGDSELREGSLMEALPDLAERELGHLDLGSRLQSAKFGWSIVWSTAIL